jgi:hypothetical protein
VVLANPRFIEAEPVKVLNELDIAPQQQLRVAAGR